MGPSTVFKQKVHKKSSFKFLLLAASLMTLCLIVIGNLVALSNSSQGCPDWPTCYGQWGLPAGTNAQFQYVHRITTIVDITLILIVTVIAVLKYSHFRLIVYPLYSVQVLFLVEVGLGWNATLSSSTQLSDTLHLVFALAILSLLILATTAAFYLESSARPSISLDFRGSFKKLILALVVSLLFLMTGGESLVATGNELSCKVWFPCSGQILSAGPMGWLPFMHSLLAALVSLMVIAMFLAAWRILLEQPCRAHVCNCNRNLVFWPGADRGSKGDARFSC